MPVKVLGIWYFNQNEFWENTNCSQIEILFKEKTIVREETFRQIVRSTCVKLAEKGTIEYGHGIFKLI